VGVARYHCRRLLLDIVIVNCLYEKIAVDILCALHCLYRGSFIIVFIVFSQATIVVLSIWMLLRSAVDTDSFS